MQNIFFQLNWTLPVHLNEVDFMFNLTYINDEDSSIKGNFLIENIHQPYLMEAIGRLDLIGLVEGESLQGVFRLQNTMLIDLT